MATTTLGRELLRQKLPDKYKAYADKLWDKGTVEEILTRIAKEDPDSYVDILQGLNDLGRRVVTGYGKEASLSVKDFKQSAPIIQLQQSAQKAFRAIYNNTNLTDEQKEKAIHDLNRKLYSKAQDIVYNDHQQRNTALGSQMAAGVRGNKSQLMQLALGNIAISDAAGRPVPYTFVENYSSGVSPLTYWLGANSSRKGYIDVQFATADAGYLSKQIANSTHNTPISMLDCGTTDTGIPVGAADSQNIGAILLKPYKGYKPGTIIDKKFLADADDDDEIIIRSPITCQAKGGICAHCAGIQNTGKFPAVGEYLALTAAKSFSEPLTQAAVGCLSPHTEVLMGDKTTKLLKDIKVGDIVMGADRLGNREPAEVTNVWDKGVVPMYTHRINDEIVVVSTLNHKVLDDFEGFPVVIPVGDCSEYTHSYIGDLPALDIEVDNEDHLFVLANGLIVSNSKHAGSVGASDEDDDMPTGFQAISQMLTLPSTFKAKAVLSPVAGKVTAIKEAPQGGHYISMENLTKPVYVPQTRKVTVSVGDTMSPGDVMTNGIPNPKEIIAYKGIGYGRDYFTKAFGKILKDSGAGTMRRNVEAFTRAFVNKVRVTNPDGYKGFMPGDVVDYDDIISSWKPRSTSTVMKPQQAIGKYLEKPMLYYTVGTPITKEVADTLDKYKMTEITVDNDPPPWEPELIRSQAYMLNDKDWMARLTGERIQPALFDAVRQGAETPYEGQSMYSRVMLTPYRK